LLRAFGQSECGHRRRVGGKEVFCSIWLRAPDCSPMTVLPPPGSPATWA